MDVTIIDRQDAGASYTYVVPGYSKRAGQKNISNTMTYTQVSDEQASESCREALMIAFG
jgi:hypothetical protein